jgi:hypothetical protein
MHTLISGYTARFEAEKMHSTIADPRRHCTNCSVKKLLFPADMLLLVGTAALLYTTRIPQ